MKRAESCGGGGDGDLEFEIFPTGSSGVGTLLATVPLGRPWELGSTLPYISLLYNLIISSLSLMLDNQCSRCLEFRGRSGKLCSVKGVELVWGKLLF